jgi:hypothetical protein
MLIVILMVLFWSGILLVSFIQLYVIKKSVIMNNA